MKIQYLINQSIGYILEKNYRIFLLLLFLGFLLKLTYLFASSVWWPDAWSYIQGAKTLMNGGVLYKDFGDIKPPGIFLIYFVLGKLFGFSNFLISIKLFIIIFQTLTSFCYYKIGRLFSDKKNSVGLGIVFLIAISIKWEFWASNIMLLVLLPISVAIYLVLKDNIRLQKHVAFLFGFTISVSTIISTNAIFYSLLLPIMSFIKYRKIKRVITDTLICISGFIVPMGFVCLYFYLNDALFE